MTTNHEHNDGNTHSQNDANDHGNQSINGEAVESVAAPSGSPWPLARPVASIPVAVSPQVTAPLVVSSSANTSPRTGAKTTASTPVTGAATTARKAATVGTAKRQVLGRQARAQLSARLGDRDLQILHTLGIHRFLTTHQIHDFCFSGLAATTSSGIETSNPATEPAIASADLADRARATRRVLARLERDHLIQLVHPRRVGGIEAGSGVSIWQLSAAAHQLLRDTHPQWPQASKRPSTPTTRFLAHTLAIGDAHLAVRRAAASMNATSTVAIEKAAARRYPSLGGTMLTLAPDLSAEITGTDSKGSFVDGWLIEVDGGSESIPTLVKKAEQYEAYYRTSDDATAALVAWVFHGPKADIRSHQLQQQLGRLALRGLITNDLHRFTRHDHLVELLTTGGQP